MSSIFERPELNKIFLVYGNLDDMFISCSIQVPRIQANMFWMTVVQFLQLTRTKVRLELLLLTIHPLRATARQRKNIAY